MATIGAEPTLGDAFGQALVDAHAGDPWMIVDERSDGYVDVETVDEYFHDRSDWPELDQAAIGLVGGRVLDVGAGAGRHALALQEAGHAPLALDTSPGAIAVCRRRGVERTYPGTIDALVSEHPEPFDGAILMGNNLALLGSRERSGVVFDTLRSLIKPDGLVVGTCVDPYRTDHPQHLAYHEANRRAGRMGGRIVLRVRYERLATDWFDYLFTSPAELDELARSAGWRVDDVTEPTPIYLAVLRPAP